MNECKCRDMLMDEIRAVNFAIVDLKLYLDTHPNECQKINIYNSFVEKYKCLLKEFHENYGPLIAEMCESDCPWQWIENPWPWNYCENKEVNLCGNTRR